MSLIIGILTIFLGYLLGSVPSAYLIGLMRGRDLTVEDGDSQLGTSLAFRRLGTLSGSAVAFIDFGKGVLTIALARMLGVSTTLILVAAIAAVAGHNWSLFLNFKGGRGAVVSYGVLASLAFWGLIIAAALAGTFFLFTRKSTLATVLLMVVLAVVLWVQSLIQFPPALSWEGEITGWFVIFPLTLLIPSLLKYVQMQKQKKASGV